MTKKVGKKLDPEDGLPALIIGEKFKTVTGPSNAPLYWLAIAAKHDLADKIWSSIVSAGKQKNLF